MAKKQAKPTPAQTIARLERDVRSLRREARNAEALRHKVAEDSKLRGQFRGAIGSGEYAAYIDREKVRNTCRWLDQRSPIFAGMIDAIVDYAIGHGLKPVGKGTGTPSDEGCRLFSAWMDRLPGGIDIRNLDPGGAWQRMFLRASLVDGDIGGVLVRAMGDPAQGGRDQAVQTIESDLIQSRTGANATPTEDDREGVIVDPATGAPLKYHVVEYDMRGGGLSLTSRGRDVLASRMIYLAHRRRPSQTRGMSILAVGADRLIGLDEYVDSVEVAAKIQAMFALLIKSKAPEGVRNAMMTGTETTTSASGDSVVRNLAEVAAGQIITLAEGEDGQSIQSSQPGPVFDSFCRSLCRMVCAGIRFPYEVAMNDFSGLNFSQARLSVTAAREVGAVLRDRFIRTVLDRLYRWRIAYLIATGELAGAVGDYTDIMWPSPPRVIVDPVQEANAAKIMIENNMMTLAEWHAEQGRDHDAVLEQRAQEVKRQAELGISPPMTPGAQQAAPAA